jgi:hypothetical protein
VVVDDAVLARYRQIYVDVLLKRIRERIRKTLPSIDNRDGAYTFTCGAIRTRSAGSPTIERRLVEYSGYFFRIALKCGVRKVSERERTGQHVRSTVVLP